MTELISVIVTTYEREDALDAVLRALSRQTDRQFEVVVADDGSGPATAALVEAWKPKLGVPLAHVRQEHRGFRAAEIRNRALLVSRGAYCIFLDGDCLARPNFVGVHRRLAEHGWFVSGNRVLMSEALTDFALRRGQEPESWTLTTWMGMRSYRAINRLMPLLRLPLGPLRKLRSRQWEDARSCNLGIWRSDLDRVDGFDAAFNGWGREDSDLLVRLLHAGVRRKDGNFATSVLHLWHPFADRSELANNHDRLIDTLRGTRIQAAIGLSALRDVGMGDAVDDTGAPVRVRMRCSQARDKADAMSSVAMFRGLAREHFTRAADVLAVLVAVAIPWSTSAVGILAALYVIAVLPTLTAADIRAVKSAPAVWLPIALVGLGILGMLWADVSWAERFGGLKPTVKLLVLALLMLHFRRSERTRCVIAGFLISCTVLLAASMVPLAVPPLRWMWGSDYGVPVKDYITQSGEFLICIFSALYLAVDCMQAGRRWAALGLLVLAALFAADIFYVNTGRTALVTLPVLLLLLGMRIYGWKGLAGAVAIGIVAGAVVWVSSPYLRGRTTALIGEVKLYETDNTRTSAGERLEFWKKSLRFMADAPVFGHGTGSIGSLYRKVATGAETNRASSLVTVNPHNQTLMVGVQLGIAGIVVLWAMWIAHVLLFRGDGFVAWFGLLVTVQNIVGSLFNSHLSDFTLGWTYVLCVGVAGGAVLRAARQPARDLD